MTTPTTAAVRCSCLPLNRRLMALLLKVDEGSVHEQGCVEQAAAEARAAALADAAAAVEGLPLPPHSPAEWGVLEENGWERAIAQVLAILRDEP